MAQSADGVRVAAPLWHDFMKKTYELKGWSSEPFPLPDPIGTDKPALNGVLAGALPIPVDKISGKRATEFTPLELIEEKVFSEPHSLLYFVKKDDPQGPPPQNPAQDPQFALWEEGVQKWAKEFSSIPLPQEYDDVHTAQTIPRISILEPGPHDTLEREKNAHLSFRVENFYPLERVEVFFDGEISKTITLAGIQNTTYTTSLKVPPSQKNALPIKVRVFDTVLNRSEAEVTVALK
jgi:hypothetical protein